MSLFGQEIYAKEQSAADKIETGLIMADVAVKNEVRKANEILAGEEGDMTQTIIIVAVFAMIAVAVMGVLGKAISEKGDQAAQIIQSASF